MSTFAIRTFGDPVLRQTARSVEEIDGALVALVDSMFTTMYAAPGVGLAAPQIGVAKRLFVYDAGDGPMALVNPSIVAESGNWVYDEGCLSIPGMSFEIERPGNVTVEGIDLDGNPIVFEAEEFLARVFQHELDHLDGVLLFDHLTPEQRKDAFRVMREQQLSPGIIPATHRL